MKKIVFMDDILFHQIDFKTKGVMLYQKVFNPIIKSVISNDTITTFELKNDKDELFDRKKFFSLGNKNILKYRYNSYNIQDFTPQQIEYFSGFFDEDTIVIGFELYDKFSDFLSQFKCKIIDMAYHHYKLFDDLTFGFYSNDIDVYNQLIKYQIPQDKFEYYANYWKIFMECNGMIQDDDLEENSVLFIGQTLLDKSVHDSGKFLNVTDFEEKLKELSKQYSKIYYVPHPYLGKKRKIIYDWVKKSPYIDLLLNRNTYGLLASDKVKKVIGISTSVLYEAQYFNKEIEYLFKPLFNVDVEFSNHSYISIVDDYWNPKFWANILSPICEVKGNIQDINYFKYNRNMLRNLGNSYWGYAQLDPIKRIPTIKESIKDLYRQYIAPLF